MPGGHGARSESPFGYWVLARTLDAREDLRQALEISRTAAKLSGGDLLYTAHLGYALARAGENDGARVVANKLQEYAQTRYVCSYDIYRPVHQHSYGLRKTHAAWD